MQVPSEALSRAGREQSASSTSGLTARRPLGGGEPSTKDEDYELDTTEGDGESSPDTI